MLNLTTTEMADFIKNTHKTFAGRPAADALGVLMRIADYFVKTPACLSVNVEAETDEEHGGLRTVMNLVRHGVVWDCSERIDHREEVER